jgi:hypothetical protein
MAGFSLSPDEIATVCGRLRTQLDGVGDLLADTDGGELTRSDLGGVRHGDLVALYEDVTRQKIPDLLRQFEATGRDLADRFESTLATYRQVDSAAAEALSPPRTGW